ncbi:hypothetical protein K6Q96_21790 [Grimontia kaedaensis]|uniref:Uncharacterized protein n=1 Tax=Grimontia kaedaensis TaxID=2872157 RepID=A0ABY4WZF4_9GAMM|nr:hypothetical protein [Grimontia kaedaensis]USH04372.1 hypothetical protein K6Q96_21790 [Grimontia kaedaensis]
MGFNDHMEEDDGYKDFLQSLISNGHLEGAAEGITKKVIAEGVDSLSSKQKWLFDKNVENYITSECKRAGCDIPWSEMYEAHDNGGICSWCAHMNAKDD